MVEEWILALAGSPWIFLALYAFATIDGFFPPIPSESVVIALAALAVSTGEPNLWVVGAVAAVGAFTGDQIAYSIGRHLPVRRFPLLRGPRGQHALNWAEAALAQRGASFIIAARYIPVGRVAVNMTAGAVGFSRLRFTGLAALAAVSWAVYSVLLGVGAGVWLGENPVLAVGAGVVGGLLLGLVVDWTLKHVLRGRRGRAVPSPRPAGGSLVAAVDGPADAPEHVPAFGPLTSRSASGLATTGVATAPAPEVVG